jgi:hypothetical protein
MVCRWHTHAVVRLAPKNKFLAHHSKITAGYRCYQSVSRKRPSRTPLSWTGDGTVPVVLVGDDGRVHPLFCRARRDRGESLWLQQSPPSRPYRPQSSLTSLAANELRPLVGERGRGDGERAARSPARSPGGQGPDRCGRAGSPPPCHLAAMSPRVRATQPAQVLNPAPKFGSARYVT